MFTTGSKLLIGSSVLATVAAVVYGITQNEALGIVGLVSVACAMAFLAGVNVWAGDSNLSALDTTAIATSEASDGPPGASIWPMIFGVGAAAVLLGLVTQQSIFTIGLVILLAAGAQWAVQAWAESASTDSTTNAAVRGRLANPLEYPLLGAFAVGGIAYALSRIMLWLSKTNTIVAFVVLATVMACIGFIFAARPSLKRGAIGGVLSVGAVAIVAGGVAAGVDGQRYIHVYETIAADAALVCNSPEEFEVDEGASQTVSTKSGTYTISLTADGNLEFDVPGPVNAGAEAISMPRSNANNIVFRNDSGETRRLTLDLGPAPVEEGAAAEEEGHSAGEEHGDKSDRNLTCTPLVEDGGAQLITVKFDEPSFAYADDAEAFRFYVPGTDAEIDVVVP
ncbi:MAG: hypothetical protein ACI83Y_000250 [Candidatus Azotimanducaceae bacterium]|jgi:hypothetical protein